MRTVAVVLFTFANCLLCFSQLLLALDTLKPGEKITGNETLVSNGGKFKMGFFSPRQDASKYLGIWYSGLQPRTVVWVANRDHPVPGSTAFFQIADDGNLIVSDINGKSYWSSGLKGSSSLNRAVKLMDSGNLILLDNQVGVINIWQSFEHPTDTFLPFMKMDKNIKLTSWRTTDDPASGNFTFQLAQTGGNSYIILKAQTQLHWQTSDAIPLLISNLLTNFTQSPRGKTDTKVVYNLTRLVMNDTGKIELLRYDNTFRNGWSTGFSEPSGQCKIHDACGSFSSCNDQDLPVCKCLPGFHVKSLPDHSSGELSKGCFRKTTSCEKKDIAFLNLTNVRVGSSDTQVEAESEAECQSACIGMCPKCQAYSYNTRISDRNSPACLIWTRNLSTLQEHSLPDGISLSVRLLISDIASNTRTCEPCGTTIVPYPLSTGPNCGDPLYFKLNCDNSTGEVNFTMPGLGPNRVAKIDPDYRKLIIQIQGPGFCDDKENQRVQLDSPFNATDWCFAEDKIEVSWLPPLEPLCHNSTDCNDWPHSTCNNDSKDGKRRCLCNKNYYWNNSTLNCTSGVPSTSQESSGRKKPLTLILVATLLSAAFVTCMVVFAYVWKRKMTHKKDRGRVQRARGMYDSERQVKDLIDLEELEEKDNEGIEIPYYDFETILAATDNFSDANKLGRGGYGSVYKGILPGEHYIAVKRLSNVSSQGLKEFKNEVVLISKLQHRNLVKLRGYCITGDEKILLYEYLPNKSLDTFLFDPMQSLILDWQMRYDIILGVVRGMLYLHQDSRLRAWRLWTENKLLDLMDPSLSESCDANQFIRCAQVSLLSIQDEPGDRPTMSQVLIMLESDTASLPTPKQPTFFMTRDKGLSSSASSSKPEGILSTETTYQEGR